MTAFCKNAFPFVLGVYVMWCGAFQLARAGSDVVPKFSFGSMRCTLVLSAVWSACIQQAVCSRSIDYEPPLPEIPLDSQDEFVDDEIRYGDGAWSAGYAKLHEAIIRRQVPAARQRFAGWTCAALHETVEIGDDSTRLCAGLANRIMGLVGTRLRTF